MNISDLIYFLYEKINLKETVILALKLSFITWRDKFVALSISTVSDKYFKRTL